MTAVFREMLVSYLCTYSLACRNPISVTEEQQSFYLKSHSSIQQREREREKEREREREREREKQEAELLLVFLLLTVPNTIKLYSFDTEHSGTL